MSESEIGTAVTQSALSWTQANPALMSCTDLAVDVTMMSLLASPPPAIFDHHNNLVFIAANWCADPPGECREPFALAITSVFARTSGEIVDADVEVNATDFTWGDLVTTPAIGGKQDLQNAITHEMGHFVGLDHTCYSGKPGTVRPVDQNNIPVPGCFDQDLSEAVKLTTMFASADPGDTSKRTLEADDMQAVCAAYPRGGVDPLACGNDEPGCAVASTDVTGAAGPWRLWASAALALAALLASAFLRRARAQARARQRHTATVRS